MTIYKSRLSNICREYVGYKLIARTEMGWGWTRETVFGTESVSDNDIVNSYFIVTPISFFPELPITRGFIGQVTDLKYPLNGEKIIAITMSDGEDFNFSNTICPAWRFYFGNVEVDLTNLERPSMKGDNFLCGYGGGIASEKKLLESPKKIMTPCQLRELQNNNKI